MELFIKQHSKVTYLGFILEEDLSGVGVLKLYYINHRSKYSFIIQVSIFHKFILLATQAN